MITIIESRQFATDMTAGYMINTISESKSWRSEVFIQLRWNSNHKTQSEGEVVEV